MGVSDAAANWHTDMLPGVMKRGEDSVGENSEEGKHGQSPPFPVAPFIHRFSVQLGYSNLIRAMTS